MFFPNKKSQKTTTLSAKEVYLTLKEETTAPKFKNNALGKVDFTNSIVSAPILCETTFFGTFDEKSFCISKPKCFHNNLLTPVACGTYSQSKNQTIIEYEFALSKCDKISCCIFIAAYLIILLLLAFMGFGLAFLVFAVFVGLQDALLYLIWNKNIKLFTKHFDGIFK